MEGQNKIVKKMPKGKANPLFVFLFFKACLGFLTSAIFLCPLLDFWLADISFSFFLLSWFLLIVFIFKENEEVFQQKLALSSGLIDILFLLFLTFKFFALSEFILLFVGFIFAEIALALWLFSLVVKGSFLEKRIKNQVEESFVVLREKLFEIKKQNKQIKELLRLKDDFLKVVNHQLRTPVAVIRGLAEALQEEKPKSSKTKKTKNDLVLASDRLASILDDLLLAQGIKGNNLSAKPISFELIALWREIILKLDNLAKQKKVKVIFKKPTSPLNLFLDRDLCFNAFYRFLENGFLYSRGKNVQIEIKKNKQEVQVYIKDKGIGFSPKEKKRLFSPFYRSKQATLESPNGSGLGLYIAKHLIEKQNGQVKIISSGKNKGCWVVISLPLYLKS